MRQIPIARPLIGEEEIKAVTEVLRSGMLAQGPVVKRFEGEFARSYGVAHAIATSNGTSALHAALLAADIGPGDEVIVPTFTFFATASAVSMCGAIPVFADVEEATFNLDPQSVASLISPRTRAVIGVHLFGQPFDVDRCRRICEEHDLLLLEDAAQAHGATWKGKPAGSLADLGCFSFYATKNMITGEGGMVTTGSSELEGKVRQRINHGQQEKYLHVCLGYNYRMTDLAAAIGLVQLGKLQEMNAARQKNAASLNRALSGLPLILPSSRKECTHVYHQYVVRISPSLRPSFIQSLQERGISTAIHYPRCLHEQPYFQKMATDNTSYPIGERLAQEVVSLPVHPGLTPEDLEYMGETIREVV
jgi:perosamine synthetase